ncbi:MAG: hypothetical protein LUH57_07370 [Ruminococcus sp.]|nr:hypothetical protein [Ruminococcus sp.]
MSIHGMATKPYLATTTTLMRRMELDPIGICCECTEYGKGVSCSFADLLGEYGEDGESLEELLQRLKEETTILHLGNENIITFDF